MTLVITMTAISVILNGIILISLYQKNKKTPQELDMQLLSDLSQRGRTLIEIRRVSPDNFFIRK